MYTDFGIDQRCEISLELPENYSVVSSLQQLNGTNRFAAENFHELVDSPFICGNSIKRYSYTSNKTTFHLCFQGEVKPDENKLITDFKKFTDFQIELFGAFPSDEYYFLFQILCYLEKGLSLCFFQNNLLQNLIKLNLEIEDDLHKTHCLYIF